MNIVVVGCGYLGMEIAALWKKAGHFVTATTRHPEKLDTLAKVSQRAVVLKGNDEDEIALLITHNDLIVVTIGADSPELYESAYLNTAQVFRHLALEMDLPRHLIYTSSTSVYGDHNGHFVDEMSALNANNAQGKILIDTEKQYLQLAELGWHVCILRLAEIYGPGRELSQRVRQMQGHVLPGTGNAYTNMVHTQDCTHAIDYAFRHHLEGAFNLADDDHPTRKELYDAVSAKFHLPKVKWDPSHTPLHAGNKRVSNHKIKAEGFAFRHPKRLLD